MLFDSGKSRGDRPQARWNSVELLLASISGCFTTTFRTIASNTGCEFTDLEVTTNATIHNMGSSSYFDDIEIRPTVQITNVEGAIAFWTCSNERSICALFRARPELSN